MRIDGRVSEPRCLRISRPPHLIHSAQLSHSGTDKHRASQYKHHPPMPREVHHRDTASLPTNTNPCQTPPPHGPAQPPPPKTHNPPPTPLPLPPTDTAPLLPAPTPTSS